MYFAGNLGHAYLTLQIIIPLLLVIRTFFQANPTSADTREMASGSVECVNGPHAVVARKICSEGISCIEYCFWEPVRLVE